MLFTLVVDMELFLKGELLVHMLSTTAFVRANAQNSSVSKVRAFQGVLLSGTADATGLIDTQSALHKHRFRTWQQVWLQLRWT